MRVSLARPAVVAAAIGAGVGSLVALVGNGWALRNQPTTFGWSSYSSLPDHPPVWPGIATDWWRLLWPAALTGAVIGVLGLLALTVRRHGVRRPLPRGSRGLLAFSGFGAVLGLGVGGALGVLARSSGAGQPRKYVDYLPTRPSRAYESALSITFDRHPSDNYVFLGICAATGLAAGVVAGTVITVAGRRGMRRDSRGSLRTWSPPRS